MTHPVSDLPPENTANSSPSLIQEAKSWWEEMSGLFQSHLELAALETQQAGKSLVKMIAAGVMVALLLVTAWLGLFSAIILWFIHMGMLASVAILLGVIGNLALAAFLYYFIREQIHHLSWPATRRSFKKPGKGPGV